MRPDDKVMGWVQIGVLCGMTLIAAKFLGMGIRAWIKDDCELGRLDLVCKVMGVLK